MSSIGSQSSKPRLGAQPQGWTDEEVQEILMDLDLQKRFGAVVTRKQIMMASKYHDGLRDPETEKQAPSMGSVFE
jgi:hypothetical protein